MIWLALGTLVLAYGLAMSGRLFLAGRDATAEAELFALRNRPPEDCRDVLSEAGEPYPEVAIGPDRAESDPGRPPFSVSVGGSRFDPAIEELEAKEVR